MMHAETQHSGNQTPRRTRKPASRTLRNPIRRMSRCARRGAVALNFGFRNFAAGLWVALVLLSLAGGEDRLAGDAQAAQVSPGDDSAMLSRGRRTYEFNCAVCHGVAGDGGGPAASMFLNRPRDFRPGVFKFRSTPSGSLPTDQDLFRTITHGLRWTGMIGRPDLNDSERIAVVRYIKTFSSRFNTEERSPAIEVAPQPRRTAALETQGGDLYRDADCISCHGEQGRGDGPSAPDLKDDWGWPSRPGDLTWRPLKRGSSLEQTYLTIATGLSGTPMPSFDSALEPKQIWSLVYYLESLVPPQRRLAPGQILGEEQKGRMALHMGAMMGAGRRPR